MNAIRTVMKWILGLLFVAAGVNHFLMPSTYVAIMPPYLPWPLALVYLSGIAEVVLGVLLLIPRYQSFAAWGLIALLIAIFPANLHMAFHPDQFPDIPPVALWLRLPVQAVLIAWAYRFTRKRRTGGRVPVCPADTAPGRDISPRGAWSVQKSTVCPAFFRSVQRGVWGIALDRPRRLPAAVANGPTFCDNSPLKHRPVPIWRGSYPWLIFRASAPERDSD